MTQSIIIHKNTTNASLLFQIIVSALFHPSFSTLTIAMERIRMVLIRTPVTEL